jgi:hypothetical protein
MAATDPGHTTFHLVLVPASSGIPTIGFRTYSFISHFNQQFSECRLGSRPTVPSQQFSGRMGPCRHEAEHECYRTSVPDTLLRRGFPPIGSKWPPLPPGTCWQRGCLNVQS